MASKRSRDLAVVAAAVAVVIVLHRSGAMAKVGVK